MIKSFKHKGLERFYKIGRTSGIQTIHANRLRLILTSLDHARSSRDMTFPGLRLHELKGSRKETWSVSVSGNWRVTFKFIDENVEVVNYEDYH